MTDTTRKANLAFWNGEQRWGCTASVHRPGQWRSGSCSNAAKNDPDEDGNPTTCGLHSEAVKQKRKAKADVKMQDWRNRMYRNAAIKKMTDEMLPLIQAIASGHNDPRTACAEWLERYNEAKETP